jgi:uncharacterized protein (DUF433 family)
VKTIPPELKDVLVSTTDTLHGGIRFAGTRVFAYQLFDYLLTGRTLDDFLADFEGVQRDQAQKLVDWQLDRIHGQLAPIS